MEKWEVDSGACRVFLGLNLDQQQALRRMGGLGRSHPSLVLMARIRRLFGYVDLPTLMASYDRDERSRSPQQLHAGAASLGAAENTQTGLTTAERDF